MNRYELLLVVRPASDAPRDYQAERQYRCRVTATCETMARRKVIKQASATGHLVSHFLEVKRGRKV